jgi:hypothetical protein
LGQDATIVLVNALMILRRATFEHAQLSLYTRGTWAMVLRLFRDIFAPAALAAVPQSLSNTVLH